jgi:hypothetical protein
MIFAVETEERTLRVFKDEAEAVAACEGLDVEAAVWLFWSNDGTPLEPVFTTPNKRGIFRVKNGVYVLRPAEGLHHAPLSEAVDEVLHFESPEPLTSAEAVKAHLNAAPPVF